MDDKMLINVLKVSHHNHIHKQAVFFVNNNAFKESFTLYSL